MDVVEQEQYEYPQVEQRTPYLLLNRSPQPNIHSGFYIYSLFTGETRHILTNLNGHEKFLFSNGQWGLMSRLEALEDDDEEEEEPAGDPLIILKALLVSLDHRRVFRLDIVSIDAAGQEIRPQHIDTGTFIGNPLNYYQIFLVEMEEAACNIWVLEFDQPQNELGQVDHVDDVDPFNDEDLVWVRHRILDGIPMGVGQASSLVYYNRRVFWIDNLRGVHDYNLDTGVIFHYHLPPGFPTQEDFANWGPRLFLVARETGVLYVSAVVNEHVWIGALGDNGVIQQQEHFEFGGGSVYANRGQGALFAEILQQDLDVHDSLSVGPFPDDCHTFHSDTGLWALGYECELQNCSGIWFLSDDERLGRCPLHMHYSDVQIHIQNIIGEGGGEEDDDDDGGGGEEDDDNSSTITDQIIMKNKLAVSTPCSFRMHTEMKSWLAFAGQKDETFISENVAAHVLRKSSSRVTNEEVQKAAAALKGSDCREMPLSARLSAQQKKLNLPVLPTTTTGSLPETVETQMVCREYKANTISEVNYIEPITECIKKVVKQQGKLDIGACVHEEPEVWDVPPVYSGHKDKG